MKHSKLMIGAAVAALTLGSGLAMAQSPDTGGRGNAPAMQSPGGSGNPAMNRGATNPSTVAPPEKIEKNGASEQRPNTRAQNPAADKAGKSETTGQSPGTTRSGEPNRASEQNKAGEPNKAREQNRAGEQNKSGRSETSGQAPGATRSGEPNRASEQNKAGEQNKMQERSSGSSGAATSGAGAAGSAGSAMNISTEQRTKIKEVIVNERAAPRVNSVNFQVNVGTVVPRGTIKLAPLPATIISLEPSWRGYEYFLVGDEIVIVEPGSLRIVAVIPA